MSVYNYLNTEKLLSVQQLLLLYDGLNVEIISTKHFRKALNERIFPLNVIGNAAIEATSLKIGESKEIYRSNKFKATVELKRVSKNVALLITGWKGVRNNKKNKSK
jgi:flagellin-specific chaperone FliS